MFSAAAVPFFGSFGFCLVWGCPQRFVCGFWFSQNAFACNSGLQFLLLPSSSPLFEELRLLPRSITGGRERSVTVRLVGTRIDSYQPTERGFCGEHFNDVTF